MKKNGKSFWKEYKESFSYKTVLLFIGAIVVGQIIGWLL